MNPEPKSIEWLFESGIQGAQPIPGYISAEYCAMIDRMDPVDRAMTLDELVPDGLPKQPEKPMRNTCRQKVPDVFKEMDENDEKLRIRLAQYHEYDCRYTSNMTAKYFHDPVPDPYDKEKILLLQRRYIKLRRSAMLAFAWDFSIRPDMTAITYRDIAQRPYPNWRFYFAKEVADAKVATDLQNQQA